MSGASLMASLMVSIIGYAVYRYGKGQRRAPHLLTGLTLMIFPYFVDDVLWMSMTAGALLLALWLARKLGW